MYGGRQYQALPPQAAYGQQVPVPAYNPVDLNHDGVITPEEFVMSMQSSMQASSVQVPLGSARPQSASQTQREVVFPFYKNPQAGQSSRATRGLHMAEPAEMSRSLMGSQDSGSAFDTRGTAVSEDVDSSLEDGRRKKKPKGGKKSSNSLIFGILACLACVGVLGATFYLMHRAPADDTNATTAAPLPAPATTPAPIADEGYDYIIVGGGASGMVVAKELSEDPSKSVLLLEGGGTTNVGTEPQQERAPDYDWGPLAAQWGEKDPTMYDIPGEYERIAWGNNYSWWSTFTFQGRGLGGSAAVNKMLYVRPTDAQVASMGWPAGMETKLVAAFNKIEQDMPSTSTPSMDGKQYRTETAEVFEQALASHANFAKLEDVNDPTLIQTGSRVSSFARPKQITKGGSRSNSATEYEPILRQRPNVKVVLNAEVKRVKITPAGHALWVDYITPTVAEPDGDKIVQPKLKSNGKIIMTAGALNTPRLLLLSGIGPTEDIQGYGELINAPSTEWKKNDYVGLDLQDHVQALMGFQKPGTPLFDPRGDSTTLTEDRLQWLKDKTGPYAQYGPTSMAYIQSPSEAASGSTQPDIQVHTLPHGQSGIASVRYLNDCNMASGNQMCIELPGQTAPVDKFLAWAPDSFSVFVTLLKTKSKAKIILDELSRVKFPIQEINNDIHNSLYLSDQDDVARLQHGMTTVFDAMTAAGVNPQLPQNKESIAASVKSWDSSHLIANSWSGSCKIGTCLDEEFRVRNTTNIFVADASALPQVPVQPIGTVMAVASMASSIIASAFVEHYQPPPIPPLVPEPPTEITVPAETSTSSVAAAAPAATTPVPVAFGATAPLTGTTAAFVPVPGAAAPVAPVTAAPVAPVTASPVASVTAAPSAPLTATPVASTSAVPTAAAAVPISR
eukprot:TRINITY_DN30989_c0_g1_i1.p1 TRINITY_DN30989_c0_g1~~TRINITY_DN30989_c0_g1_i1.p1  ORF type:complete len:917 (-),score=148.85 TRINITY_DN30989_c0_g1_i1:208-2913(-)